MAFSPDGCHLAAAGSDEKIRVYTVPDGTQDRDILGIAGAVTALAFTPDGQILVAGYDTGTLTLISWTERRIIHTIHSHSGPVTGVVVLPGGEPLLPEARRLSACLAPSPGTSLAGKTMEDIARAADIERARAQGKDRDQWRFLRTILSARFSSEIELCAGPMGTGEFDIQIVG